MATWPSSRLQPSGPSTEISRDVYQEIASAPQNDTGTVDVERDVATKVSRALAEMMGLSSDTSNAQQLIGGAPVFKQHPRLTTSLPEILEGSALVISRNIAMNLGLRPVPIKGIYEVRLMAQKKVVVVVPLVQGGKAEITPERSLANLVSTNSKMFEFEPAPYGIDWTMSTNTFKVLPVAIEEMTLKMQAQRLRMDEAWIEITYEEMMNSGTSVIAASMRADPNKSTLMGRARRIESAKVHAGLFATLDKDDYAVPNLMGTLSWASILTPTGGAPEGKGVLLVPPGMLSLTKYTQPTSMMYMLSGKVEDAPIPVPLQNWRYDPAYGVKITTVWPPADYNHSDSDEPSFTTNPLGRTVAISTVYPIDGRTWVPGRAQAPPPVIPNGILSFDVPQLQVDIQAAIAAGEAAANRAETAGNNIEEQEAARRAAEDALMPAHVETGTFQLGITNQIAGEWHMMSYTPWEITYALSASIQEVTTWPFLVGHTSRNVLHGAGNEHARFQIAHVEHIREHANLANYNFRNTSAGTQDIDVFLWRPYQVINTNCAVYCSNPGKETGLMIYSYPTTSFGINVATNELLCMLRSNIGCGTVNPQNIIILPDVQITGMVKGYGITTCNRSHEYRAPQSAEDGDDLVLMAKLKTTAWTDLLEDPVFVALNKYGPLSDIIQRRMDGFALPNDNVWDNGARRDVDDADARARPVLENREVEMPLIPFIGTVVNRDLKIVWENTGHLEGLDHPSQVHRLHGRRKYSTRKTYTMN